MKIETSEIEGGVRLIKLEGRLDLNGTYSIEVQFVKACAGDNVRVIVDLGGVSYLSSVGVPMLVNTAKSVKNRGGKMVFLRPSESVIRVLELVGIPQVISIYRELDEAVAGLQ